MSGLQPWVSRFVFFFAVGGLAFARSVVVLEVFWSATLGLSVCYFFAVGGLAFARSVVVLEVFWSATLALTVCCNLRSHDFLSVVLEIFPALFLL